MLLIRYILKKHLFPFVSSALSLMGIFLLQFLMKTADRLVGKGLDTWVIIQLIGYNLAWMVVLVVPMAVLIAVVMAFGGMSQDNEVTIMKASGVSLYKMLAGPFAASVFVAWGLVWFNNNALPDANHRAKELMGDISQTKPTLSLVPGVFSQEVNNYAILAREIDQNTNILKGVTIYDYSSPSQLNIITAGNGKIFFSSDLTKLMMDLHNGEIHESDASGSGLYRKVAFVRHKIAMDAEQFSFQQSGIASQRGDRELSANDMLSRVDSFRQNYTRDFEYYSSTINRFFIADSNLIVGINPNSVPNTSTIDNIIAKVQAMKNTLLSSTVTIDLWQKEIDKYMVEVHKKYAIPAAALVFILIGGPMGVVTRKGGFGMAASVSLFFFLVYWAFLIGGEKLADRGLVTPFWGMWSANFVLGFFGTILLNRVAKEHVTLSFDRFKKFLPKRWKDKSNEESAD